MCLCLNVMMPGFFLFLVGFCLRSVSIQFQVGTIHKFVNSYYVIFLCLISTEEGAQHFFFIANV